MAKWSLAAWLGVSEEEVARMRAEADLRERTAPHVVCRCGRVYFEGQHESLWACARRHAEEQRRVEELQRTRRKGEGDG